MSNQVEGTASSIGHESESKAPRTERGRKTLRAILDAAAQEFGEKGFHEGSISGITRRAGVALGSFYTYFDSKQAVFRALVADMSAQVGNLVPPLLQSAPGAIDAERAILQGFLEFVTTHKELYRIIDEAEFVEPESFRAHYANTAARITRRLQAGAASGEIRAGVGEIEAWALMGMNVFLGLRFGVWDGSTDPSEVARAVGALLENGLAPRRP